MPIKNPARNLLKIWNIKTKPRFSYTVPSGLGCTAKRMPMETPPRRYRFSRHQESSNIEKSTVNEDIGVDYTAELSSQNYSVTVTAPMNEHRDSELDDMSYCSNENLSDPDEHQCEIARTEAKSMLLLDMSVITRDVDDTLCRHVADEELDTAIPLHSSLSYPQYSTPTATQNIGFVDTTTCLSDRDISNSSNHSADENQLNAHNEKEDILKHVKNVIKLNAAKANSGPSGMVIPNDTPCSKREQRYRLRVHELRRVAHRYEHKKLKAKYLQQHPHLMYNLDLNHCSAKIDKRNRSVRRCARTNDLLSELGVRPPCVGQETPDNCTDTARTCVPTGIRSHGRIIPADGVPHLTRFLQNVNQRRLHDNVLAVL